MICYRFSEAASCSLSERVSGAGWLLGHVQQGERGTVDLLYDALGFGEPSLAHQTFLSRN